MIAKIWGLIPVKYKAIGLAIMAALVAASVYGYGFTRYTAGRASCEARYATAAQAAQTKAQKQIGRIQNDYDQIITNLPAGVDYPAPAVDAAIDGLWAHRGGQ